MSTRITFALPRGRPWTQLAPVLARAGVPGVAEADPEHRLVAASGDTRLIFTRPADVVTYVREGVADLGVTGKDVLLEDDEGVAELAELPLGAWRLSVAVPTAGPGWETLLADRGDALRVATSYPRATAAFFAGHGLSPHIIRLRGAVELAVVVGLADCIVDIVDTGGTLRAHGLVEAEVVHPVSLRLVANIAAFRWKGRVIGDLVTRLVASCE